MKLYRYMSDLELKKYLDGETLISEKVHNKTKRTNSVGFCFLGEETTFRSSNGESYTFTSSQCLEFLGGIVSEEIVACFEFSDIDVTSAYGVYLDPFGHFDECITIKEFNVLKYNRDICKLLKVAIPKGSGNIEFDWSVIS